jgi:hypothetical protein
LSATGQLLEGTGVVLSEQFGDGGVEFVEAEEPPIV